jgi:hypothetical protein
MLDGTAMPFLNGERAAMQNADTMTEADPTWKWTTQDSYANEK